MMKFLAIFVVTLTVGWGVVIAAEDSPLETMLGTPVTWTRNGTPVASANAVGVVSNEFVPKEIRVAPGTTVIWTKLGGTHTVTAVDLGPDGNPIFDANPIEGSFSFVFDTAGTYHYYCRFHGNEDGEGMAGTVIVE
jgi:plastocyanin